MDTSKLERGVRYNTNTGQVLPPRGTNVPAPIDISTINTPIRPIQLPEPVNNTTAKTNLATSMGTSIGMMGLNQKQQETDTALKDNTSMVGSLMEKIGLKGQRSQELKKEAGISAKRDNVKLIENESLLLREQYEDLIKEAKKNSEGKLDSGVNIEIRGLETERDARLADKSIAYKIAADDYNGALEDVKYAIEAEFEPLENELANRFKMFDVIKGDLSESEKLLIQNQLTQETKDADEFKKAKADYAAIAVQKGDANAANLIRGAKSLDDIYSIAAQNGLVEAQYQLTTDAYGNPTVFNPKTGKIGTDNSKVISGNDGKTYDLSTYATDPKHGENIKRIMGQIGPITSADQLVEAIKTFAPNSPVTANMISSAASKAGVDVTLLTSLLIAESSLGTKGAGAKTFNPGNVGNVDSGATRNYGNWQAGVDAAAQQLARRVTEGSAPTAIPGDITTVPLKIRPEVAKIRDQFDGEAIVKKFNVIQEANALVNTLAPTSTDDQALIYAFAKAMDPDSVVREGEYATVQKYAQSWANQFGFKAARITSNTPFLSAEARENIKGTIGKKYGAVESQYDNLYTDYGRRIDAITKRNDGTAFITNYKKAFQNTGTPTTPAASVGKTSSGMGYQIIP